MCVIKSKKLILHDVLLFKFVMNKCLTLQRNLTYNNIKRMTYLYNEETRLKNEKKKKYCSSLLNQKLISI